MALSPRLTPDNGPQIAPAAVLEVCLCHHLRRAARVVSRAFDAALQPIGLKVSQYNILLAIAALEPAAASAVARSLALDRTTLSRNLRPLMREGFVMTSAVGRRREQLELTQEGRAVLAAAAVHWQRAQKDLTQVLGGAHAGTLLQLLSTVAGVRA